MRKDPSEVLREGQRILDPILNEWGFSFKKGPSGPSSGGPFASGEYVNGNRTLEIHFRYSLGLVTYHFGEMSVSHESYMCVLLGEKGGNKYPGFSDEPSSAFEDLAYDLKNFATAFLTGDFETFHRLAMAAEESKKLSGIARLP